MGVLPVISYSRSKNEGELQKVLELQKRNFRAVLSSEEAIAEGFVTVVHDQELLFKMQQHCPHILAMLGEDLVGYALAMVPDFRKAIPILVPLFELTDRLLPQRNYLVMGQICIDKPHRGKGIFRGMYTYYRNQLHQQYDCLVTEVSGDNQRSLNAHLHLGFEQLHRRVEGKEEWITLVWNWNNC